MEYTPIPPNVPAASEGPCFVTGLYADTTHPAQIAVYTTLPKVQEVWSWSPATDPTLTSSDWKELRACRSVTEVKWADRGTKVLALVGDYIVLVAAPGPGIPHPVLVFATRLHDAGNAHSVEVLPDNLIAVADNGHRGADSGVQLYAVGNQRMGTGTYVQQVRYFPSTHGLLWDATRQWLWAVGNTHRPTSPGAQGLLRAYRYDPATKRLKEQHIEQQAIGTGLATKEAPDEWDSPHDLTGIPHKRQLLITTEEDVYTCDIGFNVEPPVPAPQLAAFKSHSQPRNTHRLPRSRFKSIGMRPTGELIYTQPSTWGPGQDYPDMIGLYAKDTTDTVTRPGRTTYKARWFEATPGWDTPPVQTPPPPSTESA
jgi:hypothetical protein